MHGKVGFLIRRSVPSAKAGGENWKPGGVAGSCQPNEGLGGGFKHFYVHPENWGHDPI